MKKPFLTLAATMICCLTLAQETPMWVRKNAISPDGTKIAFSYKGDIYVVSSTGGNASRITTNEAYESDPVWTPDSKEVVFSSYREGSKDIYRVPAQGGIPKRLTDYPGNETPKAVLEDGSIVFLTSLQQDASYDGFPGTAQTYYISKDGGRPVQVTSLPISEISVSKDGKVLYEDYKGYEDPLRKHHTSSVTRDIWLYRGDSPKKIDGKGEFKQLSTYEGENRNPVFSSDGDTFYFLSEKDGKTLNIYKSSLSSPKSQTQLTFETKNPVRFISVAEDGTIAYSYNGELYTLKEGGKPSKVEMTVIRDEDERDIQKMTRNFGATAMAVSPDEKEIAVVLRGDVFVTSADYKTTRRITNTPEQERNVCFSKDGRELYYSSERNGCWSIYKTSLTEKDDKYFTYAVKTKEERFTDEGETCFLPKVSPDGKWVAFLHNRTEIMVKSTNGKETKSLLKGALYSYSDGDQNFQWSPDSRYIMSNYQANGGWNNADVAIIEVETGKVTDLTESGYSDGNFKWALGGKAITWESDRKGYRSHGSWGAEGDVFIMFFDKKRMSEFYRDKESDELATLLADDKTKKKEEKEAKKDSTEKKPEIILDLNNLEDRTGRLTRSSANLGDHFLTPDGKTLYYITPLESGNGLCAMDIKDGSIKVVQRNVYGSIIPSPDGKSIYLFSGNGITKMGLAGGQPKSISYSGDYEFKPKAERAYMFEHVWKQVKEKFYDPDIHGVDWAYYHDNYKQFLPYIDNNFDFQDLLSEMLGELNGSHTGARYYYSGDAGRLGTLGVIYDLSYAGDGLMIKEVLSGGVIDLADCGVQAGDMITAIEGHEIKAGEDWYPLLTGKDGKKIIISVSKGGKKAEDIIVTPSSSDANLLYRRWVRQREEMVEKLSGGRIGYVHVKGMDSDSFRNVYLKALGKYRNCDALIVDTRHNGGGWLHDDLATFLGGKKYIDFKPRNEYIGSEPYSKWTKPSCVLVCEDNYSDASGFPYTYKTLGIGKLIGAPVPGTMTAVWWEYMIDQTMLFGIPEVGSFGLKEGRFLENMQIVPDIVVYNDPASVLNGEDKQLEAAVKEMLAETEK